MGESVDIKEKRDGVDVEWRNHNNIFVENVWKLFSNAVLFDTDVVCAEKVIGAHSVILAALCEFADFGEHEPQRSPPLKLQFDGIGNSEVCKCFLEFLYRGKTQVDKVHLKSFLTVLKQAGIRGLDRVELSNLKCDQNDISKDSEGTDSDFQSEKNKDNSNGLTASISHTSKAISPSEETEETKTTDDLNHNLSIEVAYCDNEISTVVQTEEDSASIELDFGNNELSINENFSFINADNVEAVNGSNCSTPQYEPSDNEDSSDEEDVETVCASLVNDLVETIEEQEWLMSRSEEIDTEFDINFSILNDESEKEIAILMDTFSTPQIKNSTNRRTEENFVHRCSCSLNFTECDGEVSCFVNDAIFHCQCRFMNHKKCSVLFEQAQIDVEKEDKTSCCSTSDVPAKLQLSSASFTESTNWYLENYVSHMLDISVPDEDRSTFDEFGKKYLPNLPVCINESQPIKSSCKDKPTVLENCKDKGLLKIDDLNKRSLRSTSSLKPTIRNQSGCDSFEKLANDYCFVCKLCSSKVYGGATSLGLHMVVTHNFESEDVSVGKIDISSNRVPLSCLHCNFKAYSENELAFHLTDVHKNMILSPSEQPRIRRVTRYSEEKQRQRLAALPKGSKDDREMSGIASVKNEKTDNADSRPRRSSARIKYRIESDDDNSDDESVEGRGGRVSNKHSMVTRKTSLVSVLKCKSDNSVSCSPTDHQPKKKVRFDINPKIVVEKPIKPKTKKTAAVTKPSVYVCKRCHFETESNFFSKCHYLEHVNSSTFICSTCRETFHSKSGLMMHMLKHHKSSDYFNCMHCSYVTPWKTHFDNHLIKEHSITLTHICHICNKSLQSYSALDKHRRSSHYNKVVVKTEKKFKCPKCKYEATDAKKLYGHVFQKHIRSDNN
ncbi:hypothetical protein CHUAL_004746 [Chamberlinius hualienensis]